MNEPRDPEPGKHLPEWMSPPNKQRASGGTWSPEQGIVFSSPIAQATHGTPSKLSGNSELLSTSPHIRRSFSSSFVSGLEESHPRKEPVSPGLSVVSRIRSSGDLRYPVDQLNRTSWNSRQFSSSAKTMTKEQRSTCRHRVDSPEQSHSSSIRSFFNGVLVITAMAKHWISAVFGLQYMNLSFSGFGTLISTVSSANSLSVAAEILQEENSEGFWTYKTDSKETGNTPAVRICTNKTSCDETAALFLEEEVVGFDLEWNIFDNNGGIKSNVALIQVASPNLIALFHLARFPEEDNADMVPPNLRTLIESKTVLKTGVNIAGDCNRLRKYIGLAPKGIFELSHTHRLVKYGSGTLTDIQQVNKKLVALAKQVEEHLGLPLSKEEDVRTSNWAKELTEKKTLYAASDAYACLRLFQVLEKKRKALDPIPPRPACQELGLPIRLANGQTVAEYLADQKVDAAIVENVIRIDSESESDEEWTEESDDELDDGKISSTASPSLSPIYSRRQDAEANRSLASSSSETESASFTPSVDDLAMLEEAKTFAETTQALLYNNANTSESTPGTRKASIRSLRRPIQAYFLWHTKHKGVGESSRLLSVKPSTVAYYVLDAITVAKLPYDKERLNNEVIPKVPAKVLSAKPWMLTNRT